MLLFQKTLFNGHSQSFSFLGASDSLAVEASDVDRPFRCPGAIRTLIFCLQTGCRSSDR
jgi:hypothetical protein